MFKSTYTCTFNKEHVSAVLAIFDMTEIKIVKMFTDAFDAGCEITFKANKKELNKITDRLNKYVGEAFMA